MRHRVDGKRPRGEHTSPARSRDPHQPESPASRSLPINKATCGPTAFAQIVVCFANVAQNRRFTFEVHCIVKCHSRAPSRRRSRGTAGTRDRKGRESSGVILAVAFHRQKDSVKSRKVIAAVVATDATDHAASRSSTHYVGPRPRHRSVVTAAAVRSSTPATSSSDAPAMTYSSSSTLPVITAITSTRTVFRASPRGK